MRKLPPPPPADGRPEPYVYFIQIETCPIKIGFTTNLGKRMDNMATTIPGEMRVLWLEPGGRGCEMTWHKRFSAHRIGKEWFRPDIEIMAELAALRVDDEHHDFMQCIYLGDARAHEQWNAPWWLMEPWWLPFCPPRTAQDVPL